MSKILTEGDPVRVVERETSVADIKSGLFYPYYQNLTGKIAKIYPDGTVAVTIDPQSLPPEIRSRHETGTEAERQKWLDKLSDEARNRLTAAEKKFQLRYSILIALSDLVLEQGGAASVAKAAPEPPRKSLADLEAEEQRHLEEVVRKGKGA